MSVQRPVFRYVDTFLILWLSFKCWSHLGISHSVASDWLWLKKEPRSSSTLGRRKSVSSMQQPLNHNCHHKEGLRFCGPTAGLGKSKYLPHHFISEYTSFSSCFHGVKPKCCNQKTLASTIITIFQKLQNSHNTKHIDTHCTAYTLRKKWNKQLKYSLKLSSLLWSVITTLLRMNYCSPFYESDRITAVSGIKQIFWYISLQRLQPRTVILE